MILTESNKKTLIEGAKALGYRLAIYAIVLGSAFGIENLHLLAIPPALSVGIGFVLGEINSWAHTQYDIQGKIARAFKRTAKALRPGR